MPLCLLLLLTGVATASVFMPYPWQRHANLTAVAMGKEVFVVVTDLHSTALEGPPMPVTIDVFRGRLKAAGASRVVVSSQHSPGVLAQLKQQGVVPPRAARAKLVSLDVVQRALLMGGYRPDWVQDLVQMYKQVVSQQQQQLQQQPPMPPTMPDPEEGGGEEAHMEDTTHTTQPTTGEGHPEAGARQEATPAPGGFDINSNSSCTTSWRPPNSALLGKRGLADLMGGSSSSSSSYTQDWPTTLPQLAFPPKALVEDYGLQALLPGMMSSNSSSNFPFAKEVPAIQAFFTEGVHMGRGMEYPNPVKQVTWEGALDSVQGFLGFMFKVGGGEGIV